MLDRNDQLHSYFVGRCVVRCDSAAKAVREAGIEINAMLGEDSESIANLASHIKSMSETLTEVADTLSQYKFDRRNR